MKRLIAATAATAAVVTTAVLTWAPTVADAAHKLPAMGRR